MHVSIDVVIPSFRLEEKYILPILRLKKPADATIRFYLVADNPAVVPSPAIRSLVDNEQVFLEINPQNLGAALTRNKGLEMGKGDWILFLDDDIECREDLLETYAAAARQYPDETGFIGLINLPAPKQSFSHAITINGAMDVFATAAKYPTFAWGATANIMIRRAALGDIRFSLRYPKFGGGEDVDFFIKVRARNGYRDYKSLPEAVAEHPWWDNERPNFKRPFRYGIGNSWLGQLNPQHAYHDLLNTPELLLLLAIATIVLTIINIHWLLPMLLLMAGILVIEAIAITIQALKRKSKRGIKIFTYLIQLRLVYESGLLWGNLSRFRLTGMGQRFNYNGSFKKNHFYKTSTYRIVKWILYPVLVYVLWRYFR
ncbi:glycosyltransferase family A protein [Chitinophaga sp. MM2321]|uniref:glycosyltransferase family 2 protein n=1 Tax=Chitinophaga sp. MM2321 TaxID=3137178 RepID=UPI0032D5AC9A